MPKPTKVTSINPKTEDQDVSESLKVFESRWRYAVFPAMITFVLLIGFMFYLIYGMLQRMEDLSTDIHKMSIVITEAMPVMQGGILGMSSRMQWVGEDMKEMSKNMGNMSTVIVDVMPKLEDGVSNMSSNISDMTIATSSMAMTTHNMGQNLWSMNRNISKPLSAMNKFLPWSNSNQSPRPMAPPVYYQAPAAPVYEVPVQNTAMTGAIATMTPPATGEVVSSAISKGENKYKGFCASCHGIRAEGGVGLPLTGKTAVYIKAVLAEYRAGKRKGTMTGVMEVITDDDIANVAAYIEAGKF